MIGPWQPTPREIVRRTRETADTFTLGLDAGERGLPFQPGQFNMIYVFGVGEAAISISGDPARPDRLVHTIRAVGTVTTALAKLRRGSAVGIRGPFGSAWPLDAAAGGELVVIAGGLGLAPLRPVIYHALRHRDRFRRVTVLYGARSPADLVYRGELERWQARGLDVRVTVDHAADPGWTGPVGVVPALIADVPLDPATAVAMICGPEVMMRFCVRALAVRGLPAARVFVSLERNMRCAVGLCGHCQFREAFVCKDGPVVRFDRIAAIFDRREV